MSRLSTHVYFDPSLVQLFKWRAILLIAFAAVIWFMASSGSVWAAGDGQTIPTVTPTDAATPAVTPAVPDGLVAPATPEAASPWPVLWPVAPIGCISLVLGLALLGVGLWFRSRGSSGSGQP